MSTNNDGKGEGTSSRNLKLFRVRWSDPKDIWKKIERLNQLIDDDDKRVSIDLFSESSNDNDNNDNEGAETSEEEDEEAESNEEEDEEAETTEEENVANCRKEGKAQIMNIGSIEVRTAKVMSTNDDGKGEGTSSGQLFRVRWSDPKDIWKKIERLNELIGNDDKRMRIDLFSDPSNDNGDEKAKTSEEEIVAEGGEGSHSNDEHWQQSF